MIYYLVCQAAQAGCNLSPCDVLEIFTTGRKPGQPANTGCSSELHWRKLDRRLRAIEQPGMKKETRK